MHNRLSNYQSAKDASSSRTSGLGTYAKKGPLDGMTRSREHKEKNTAQPYGSDGNYTTTHANKTINTLQQPEKDYTKTVGYYEPTITILDHHAFSPKLCARDVVALGRTFAGVFRRSFDLKLFGSTAVFVHAANLGNLSRKVCCFSNYKVRIVRTFEYPPFRSTSNPTLSD